MSNIHSLSLTFFLLLESTASVCAQPLHGLIQPRQNRDGRKDYIAGVGIGLAVFLSLLVILAFNLGRRRERTGNWQWWKEPEPAPKPCPDTDVKNAELFAAYDLKSRISSPYALSSSAPVELHSTSNLVEIETRPRFLELPTKEVYEMGQATPRTPRFSPRRSTWVDRAWRRSRHSLFLNIGGDPTKTQPETKETSTEPITIPKSVFFISKKAGNEEKWKSLKSPPMDFRGSGLEYMRHVYGQGHGHGHKKNDFSA